MKGVIVGGNVRCFAEQRKKMDKNSTFEYNYNTERLRAV